MTEDEAASLGAAVVEAVDAFLVGKPTGPNPDRAVRLCVALRCPLAIAGAGSPMPRHPSRRDPTLWNVRMAGSRDGVVPPRVEHSSLILAVTVVLTVSYLDGVGRGHEVPEPFRALSTMTLLAGAQVASL